MKKLQQIAHAVQMVCSSRYAINYRVTSTLTDLQAEIARCHHQTANMELVRSLVQTICDLERKRLGEAIELLVQANNFDCKAYAIELDPAQGKTCGDQLMETARDNLEQCGRPRYAAPARKKLILARKWYRNAGTLTHTLSEEINTGLDRTKWLLVYEPYSQMEELVDPEGH